ncbi:hypothetical protein [Nitrobacter sp.]|uniref:hypothetical protein n=1 Tax=Nitrobacter sp. TaxID=29420 RepID=UPI003F64E133
MPAKALVILPSEIAQKTNGESVGCDLFSPAAVNPDFGLNRTKIMNVIDYNISSRSGFA